MKKKKPKCSLAVGAALIFLAGCQDHNQQAILLGAPSAIAPQIREMQTLTVPDVPEAQLLRDATQVLLDLGFAIEESSSEFGVLVGGKQRDATEAGQVAAAIAITVVAALFLVAVVPAWDQDQTIRATVTTRPLAASQGATLRITFERRVTNNQGGSRYEALGTPELYQEFFTLLRQGISSGART